MSGYRNLTEAMIALGNRPGSWGPLLAGLGCGLLAFVALSRPLVGDLATYILLGCAVFFAVAGAVMMFVQLAMSGADTAQLAAPATGDLENAIAQLNKNYELLRRQTNQGFVIASVFMALGLVVILIGAVGDLFGLTKEGHSLTTVAGIIMEFISGTGLGIYTLNFRRLNLTHDRLHETWKVLAAFKQVSSLSPERRDDVVVHLIEALVNRRATRTATRRPTRAGGHAASAKPVAEVPAEIAAEAQPADGGGSVGNESK